MMFACILALVGLASAIRPFPCDSEVYCRGQLLRTVQMHKVYPDSKTFVDMKMRFRPEATLASFEQFMQQHDQRPSKSSVVRFVDEHFEEAGSEFVDWLPDDFQDSPAFLQTIADEHYRSFAGALNHVWKELGRKMRDEVKEDEELYSILWVPNPVIVPGGRFREFYYWDSYWIVQGLLHSEMFKTVKGMLENFAYIIDNVGHIPNGGRVYYLERSQPPLYIPMVKLYEEHTKDIGFVRDHIHSFDREFDYWITNHQKKLLKDGIEYTVFVYGDKSQGPRPESYSEDVESAQIFATNELKDEYYAELKAAAESGWDFSSRWFINNETNNGNLTDIKTRSIAPVDLNAFLYWNAIILRDWHKILGNNKQYQKYSQYSDNILKTMEVVFWDDEVGVWLDYDLANKRKRDYFYASNVAPLWAGCYDKNKTDVIVPMVINYLKSNNMILNGGVPTSKEYSGEQWDYPNAWPPLIHYMIVGLHNTGNTEAQKFALDLTDTWVRSNYMTFSRTGAMYEKYDATNLGGYGRGGEYEVQLGFGWTNGVIMDLLHRYGDILHYENVQNDSVAKMLKPKSSGQLLTAVIALLATALAGYIGITICRSRGGNPLEKVGLRPWSSKYSDLDENGQRSHK